MSFADAIKVERLPDLDGQGRAVWKGHVTSRYNVIKVPNGGYLMAILLNAMEAEQKLTDGDTNTDCLTMNCTFVNSGTPDQECFVRIAVIKHGRRITSLSFSLEQGSKLKITGTAMFGKYVQGFHEGLHYGSVVNHATLGKQLPPSHPELQSSANISWEGTVPRAVFQQLKMEFSPGDLRAYKRMLSIGDMKDPCPPVYRCYMGHKNPSDHLDSPSLALFSDANIPTVKGMLPYGSQGWVPSLSFDLNFFSRPRSGLDRVLCIFLSSSWSEGRVIEECELYDPETKELLACGRQSAMLGVVQAKKSKI